MSLQDERLALPRFKESLAGHVGELHPMTLWRYVNGFIPGFGRWLIDRPDVLRALLQDAEAIAVESPLPTEKTN